jgi:DNA-binding response OmpR family regulator
MFKRILIIDDDALLRRGLAFHLEKSGYHALTAATVEDALAQSQLASPDLVLLDAGAPEMDGLQALRYLKEKLHAPIIYLANHRDDFDEVLGLEMGADDYITKPFDNDVLLAHIKAVLRRTNAVPANQADIRRAISLGDLTIDPRLHEVKVAGRQVELTPREFDLLHAFALRPNQVLSTEDLLNSVWGAEFAGQPQVVYVHIRWLREKLEEDPNHPRRILTVRGVGYRLVEP